MYLNVFIDLFHAVPKNSYKTRKTIKTAFKWCAAICEVIGSIHRNKHFKRTNSINPSIIKCECLLILTSSCAYWTSPVSVVDASAMITKFESV